MEIWIDVKDFEGMYQVSNLGRVKSLDRDSTIGRFLKERILSPGLSRGYPIVVLSKEGHSRSMTVHQLVAIAFLNHIPNGYDIVVDHIDNDKLNNNVNNLQLISHRQNCSKDKKGGASKYIGVTWDKKRNKWIAQIHINGKQKYLGSFTNELEASRA